MAKNRTERTRWVSYLRVSTVEQAEKERWLTAQRRSADEFAERHNAVIDHHYVEAGASGTDTRRTVFNELLGAALRLDGDIGRDLGELLDTPFGRMLRREGDVTAFQLDLLLYGHRRPLAVNVRVPNRVKFDRRRGTDVVEEYLKEAGFMQVNESIAS